MRFPDIEVNDLTIDEERTWLAVLLAALGDQSEDIVSLLSDATVHGILVNLTSALQDEEANLGSKWLHVLQLE